MIFHCCDKLRRDKVAAHPTLNGIDYLEVIDRELPLLDPTRQRTLLVYCLKPLPSGFSRGNVVLRGGERVKNIQVEWAASASPLPAQLSSPAEASTAAIVAARPSPKNILVVRVAEPGDYSTYTLRFVAAGEFRSAVRRHRFLVQGRVPLGLRLQAGPSVSGSRSR